MANLNKMFRLQVLMARVHHLIPLAVHRMANHHKGEDIRITHQTRRRTRIAALCEEGINDNKNRGIMIWHLDLLVKAHKFYEVKNTNFPPIPTSPFTFIHPSSSTDLWIFPIYYRQVANSSKKFSQPISLVLPALTPSLF